MSEEPTLEKTVLFVTGKDSGLPPSFTTEDLRAKVDEVEGTVVRECEVIVSKYDGTSRGFGLVRLATRVMAERTKAALDGAFVTHGVTADGQPQLHLLMVRWALGTSTLRFSDLDPSVDPAALHDCLKQFGRVVSFHHSRDWRCRSGLGSALVRYDTRETAAKVQQVMSEHLFLVGASPCPLRAEFALAEHQDSTAPMPSELRRVPPPHFAQAGTLEFDFALRWRELGLAHEAETDALRTAQWKVLTHPPTRSPHPLTRTHFSLQRGPKLRYKRAHSYQEREALRREQYLMFQHELRKFQQLEARRV